MLDSKREIDFWMRVRSSSGCWIWTGEKSGLGYGIIRSKDLKKMKAHRVSWELHYGPIPDGMLVCHKCDNPPCIRPDHLFLGSHADNYRDAKSKGRAVISGMSRTDKRGEHNGFSKLTDVIICEIRKRYSNGELQHVLAAEFCITQSTVSRIVKYKRWNHNESAAST